MLNFFYSNKCEILKISSVYLITGVERCFSHFKCSVASLVAADESSNMAELDAFDTRHLLQLVVADSEPALVQELAADERSFLDRNALDSEVGGAAFEQDVLDAYILVFEFVRSLDFAEMFLPWTEALKLDDLSRRVNGETIIDGLFYDFASWQPGRAKILDFVKEFLSDVLLCFVEFLVDFLWCLVFGPSWVEVLHSVRQMSVDAVLRIAAKLWHRCLYHRFPG